MAINQKKGFALLVAVVFSSVLLALGTALSSIAYKQQILGVTGERSQYAFYAAEAALECALLEVQQLDAQNGYAYANHGSAVRPNCAGTTYPTLFGEVCYNTSTVTNPQCAASERVVKQKIPIAFSDPLTPTLGTETLCAEITVYETENDSNGNKVAGKTEVYAEGFDVPCSKVGGTSRIVVRGLNVKF